METWLPVPDYEVIYEASDQGRIRRIGRARGAKVGRILKATIIPRGYTVVALSKNNIRNHQLVHRIIAWTFLGPCPAGHEVNHRNGISGDNRLVNLEYVTHRENQRHAYFDLGSIPKIPTKIGENHKSAKLTEAQVLEIRRLVAEGELSKISIGKMFNVTDVNIGCIAHRKTWKHI